MPDRSVGNIQLMGLGRPGSKGPGPGVGNGSGSGGGRRGSSGSPGGTPGRGGLGSGSSGPPGSRCSCTQVSVVAPLRRGSFRSAMVSTLILFEIILAQKQISGNFRFQLYLYAKTICLPPTCVNQIALAARWVARHTRTRLSGR